MENLILKKKRSGEKGVFAQKNFKKSEKILDFTGKVLMRYQVPKVRNPKNDRFLQIGESKYLDPSGKFNDSFTHSCNPNAGLVIKGGKTTLTTIKNIKKGEEITWDYSTTMDENFWEMNCTCGEKNCRQKIRDFKYLPKNIQKKYADLNIVPKYNLKYLNIEIGQHIKRKYDFLVLGAGGMQGKIVVKDLVQRGYKIYISELYQNHLDDILNKYPRLPYKIVDLRDKKATIDLIKKVKPFLVINCAEADWNMNVYEACLKNKAHVIDLGSSDGKMTKQQFAMDSDFKKNKLVAITGCGSTPGINNIMLSYAAEYFDTINSVEAGFCWNSNTEEFVVPFSMPSIAEEFTDPATLMKNGKWMKIAPFKTIADKRKQGIGMNKCFQVRHPEPYTFYHYYRHMGLKNIKFFAGFPDHSFYTIYNFIQLGFTNMQEVDINGKKIIPLDFLTESLRNIKRSNKYTENEVLWVDIVGKKNKKRKRIYMECIVETLPDWKDAGCNIDTGLPASIIAQMVRNGKIHTFGSGAPEGVVPTEYFFKKLRDKKMKIYMNNTLIN